MKRKQNKSVKETKINCHECLHKEVCEKYNLVKSNILKHKSTYTLDTVDQLGKNINCKNFYYKKFDYYQIDDFKDVLKEMIDNSKNAYHLLMIHSIFRLLEKEKEKHETK